MIGGYAGKYLDVDLSTGKVDVRLLDKEMVEKYVGGGGFIAKILWDQLPPNADPLGWENILIITTGPMTATLAPTGGSWYVGFKSPATGIYGEGRGGGYFGPELKFAGYDTVILRGRSPEPVYLYIEDDKVEILPADELWGKDFFKTVDMLEEKYKGVRVLGIGPAGENLVKFACLMSDRYRAAGRGGAGAVMGSKNLKAIAVRGSKDINVADKEGFIKALKDANKTIFEHPATAKLLPDYGTSSLVNGMSAFGAFPTRNHRSGVFESAEKISGETMAETILVKTRGCYSCNIKCTRYTMVREGEYAGVESEGPEYETINAFGARCGIDNLEAIAMANMNANRLGLETISTGTLIAFAMELYEEGLLSKDECNGLELNFGNHQAMNRLLEDIAYRRGLGDILAEGVKEAAVKIGRGSEKYAMHVKGLELTATEPRAAQDSGLGHAVASRGGDHLRPWSPAYTLFSFGSEELGLGGTPDPIVPDDKARVVALMQRVSTFTDMNGMCKFTVLCNTLAPSQLAHLYTTITGISFTAEDVMQSAARVWNLQRALNTIKFGITSADDTLPHRFLNETAPDGPAKGKVVELDKMKKEYYSLEGWDDNGVPRRERILELGLDFVAEELGK
ncbi:MAG: aldehyde:ferredoxin oxidoreductase [Dethiobacter sp.]|jgi:aldehyde:ferredoxin oxidoreductase|nr:MAG: aldehyde:ferredoxin oxidoreductase [Dethiobacter sp.]